MDEYVFDLHGHIIPNYIDPSFTTCYTKLSHIAQRIVTNGAKFSKAPSWTTVALLEIESKVESWVSSMDENNWRTQSIISKT